MAIFKPQRRYLLPSPLLFFGGARRTLNGNHMPSWRAAEKQKVM
jgi:hypothetical protein